MYVLPQAGKTFNDKLKLHLTIFGYEPAPITSDLWRNQVHPLQFSLVMDDFGVKYEHQSDITHLLDSLKTIYEVYKDWYGKL